MTTTDTTTTTADARFLEGLRKLALREADNTLADADDWWLSDADILLNVLQDMDFPHDPRPIYALAQAAQLALSLARLTGEAARGVGDPQAVTAAEAQA